MLKELVTSIFCCLPHHHNAPAPVVAERITPISVVSEEPYNHEEYHLALRDGLFDKAISMGERYIVEKHGQQSWDELDALCERYAQEGLYESSFFYNDYKYENDPVQLGRNIVFLKRIPTGVLHVPLEAYAKKNRDKRYAVMAVYFWLIGGGDDSMAGRLRLTLRSEE